MKAKTPRLGGRPKLYEHRILLPLSEEMLAAIDRALLHEETRLELIRTAIARELRRRQK